MPKRALDDMEIITDSAAMRYWSRAHRASGRTISLVPTMGYLHAGHLSLVREAMSRSDVCVVSIYVNPTQFAANEDFGTYPRDEQGDLMKLRELGVTAVFMPERLYVSSDDGGNNEKDDGNTGDSSQSASNNNAHETYVTAERLQLGLCSKTRPHFFRGVATVVTKLFNICDPDVAVFGKKDYQQWRVIKRVVRDLDFAIDVVGAPLAREPDGLAMSSRNVRLTPEHREKAVVLSRSLRYLKNEYEQFIMSPPRVDETMLSYAVDVMRDEITKAGGVVDYVEVCDQESLEPVKSLPKDSKAVCLVAAKFGDVRLLDNMEIGGEA